MPTTIGDPFAAAGLERDAVVRWGVQPPTSESGVYVVALTDSATAIDGTLAEAPLGDEAFEAWLRVCPELTLDGVRPITGQLKRRIQAFWIADETILYVGLASTLSSRLRDYFNTPIGARRPHSGGYFLKLLSNLEKLWVHYAPCTDPAGAEDDMLRRFCEGVTDAAKEALKDPEHPFPFANLEWPRGTRKAHGIRGAREPRRQSPGQRQTEPSQRSIPSATLATARLHRTQRVTASDLRAGQIRVPAIGAAPTKSLFPTTKAAVDLILRGQPVQASWDPRMGPDRERSGVLRVGAVLRRLVREDDQLIVAKAEGGGITIELTTRGTDV